MQHFPKHTLCGWQPTRESTPHTLMTQHFGNTIEKTTTTVFTEPVVVVSYKDTHTDFLHLLILKVYLAES
jgi:hypothetical protein